MLAIALAVVGPALAVDMLRGNARVWSQTTWPCRSAHCRLASPNSDEEGESAVTAAIREFSAGGTSRPMSGEEAFTGTQWSLLVKMREGGSTMFTVELFDDASCRFSDSAEKGGWSARLNYLIFEKPKALFKETLYFSAKLETIQESGRLRLVDGLVQKADAPTADPKADGEPPKTGNPPPNPPPNPPHDPHL